MILRDEDEKLALKMCEALDDQKLKQKTAKMLARSEPRLPREFFWTTGA